MVAAPTMAAKVVSKIDPTTTTPGITLELSSDKLSMSVLPGQTDYANMTATASTTGARGYTLTITTSGTDIGGEYTNALVNSDAQTEISALSSVVDTGTGAFPLGKWGYATDAQNFDAVPVYGDADEIASSNQAITDDVTDVKVGVSADYDQASGAYTNTMVLTLVANPIILEYDLDFDGNVKPDEPTGIDGQGAIVNNMPSSMHAETSDAYKKFTIPSQAPSRVGYMFLGWAEQDDATTADYQPGDEITLEPDDVNANTQVSKTLYAVWRINNYALSFDPNGGTYAGTTSVTQVNGNYAATVTVTDPTTNASYDVTFSENNSGAIFSVNSLLAERSFLRWDLVGSGALVNGTYTFGAGNGTLTATYAIVSNSFNLPAISRAGHNCKWALNSAGTGTVYTGGDSMTVNEDKIFYAVCNAVDYTLTVNPNGGTWGGSTTNSTVPGNYADVYTLADPSVSAAYTVEYNANSAGATYSATSANTTALRAFSAWDLAAGATGSISGSNYTFGTTNDTVTAEYSTIGSFVLPAISKTGYTCKWAEDSASGTQYGGETARSVSGDTTYYAVCTPNVYTITFDSNGGTGLMSKQNFTYNVAKNLLANQYSKTNYVFVGWATSQYATTATFTNSQSITFGNDLTAGNKTLYAVWKPTLFGITTMQQMTSTICASTTTPNKSATNLDTTGDYAGNTNYIPQVTLRDTQGSYSYKIRKLADGHCWMVEDYKTSPNVTYNGHYFYNRSSVDSLAPGGFGLPTSSMLTTLKSTYTASQIVDMPLSFSTAGGYSNTLTGSSWSTTAAAYYHRMGASTDTTYEAPCYTVNHSGTGINQIGHETGGCGGDDNYLFMVRYVI